jgi:hypothetical protein
MELYKKSDIDIVDQNIDKIIESIEDKRKILFPRPRDLEVVASESDTDSVITTTTVDEKKGPSFEDVKEIVQIVLNFVKEKKRKIYGGKSLNDIIKSKNKADAFYKEDELPDIDIYSAEPISDVVELCNTLHAKGYTDVFAREAMHKETYKIFTKGYNAIDLSYAPKMIYDNIPFIEIDGIRYTAPSFAMIDMFRILTEPLFSSWRWSKVFKRLQLIQKYYPIQKINEKPLNVYAHKKDMIGAISIIEEFIVDNENVYLFGDFGYNQLVKESKSKQIKEVTIGIFQIVSTDYKHDAAKLIKMLKESESGGSKITYNEYYPFWSLTGHSVEILFNGEVIVKMYHYLKRCTPVSKVKYDNGIVQIGSFDYILLMEMVLSFRQKVLRDNNKKRYHDTMISNLIVMREQYFKENNKTLLDPGVFQSFVASCVGIAVDPIMEAKRQRKANKEAHKSTFSYKPVRELKTKWIFDNTSGQIINNPKNLKIKL